MKIQKKQDKRGSIPARAGTVFVGPEKRQANPRSSREGEVAFKSPLRESNSLRGKITNGEFSEKKSRKGKPRKAAWEMLVAAKTGKSKERRERRLKTLRKKGEHGKGTGRPTVGERPRGKQVPDGQGVCNKETLGGI